MIARLLSLPLRLWLHIQCWWLRRQNRAYRERYEEYLKTLPPEEQQRERAELAAELAAMRKKVAEERAGPQA